MANTESDRIFGRPRDNSVRQYFIFNKEEGYSYCQVPDCTSKIKVKMLFNHSTLLNNYLY